MMPPVGHYAGAFYWTVLLAHAGGADEPQVRRWTGYAWLEAGREGHIAADGCLVVSPELEPPEPPA
jgi:hypothetical protein